MERVVRLRRVVLGSTLQPLWVTTGTAAAVVGLAGFAQALLASAVVPDPDLLGRMALGASGVAAAVAIPLGLVAGVIVGLRDCADTGGWRTLRACGVSGRDALRALLPLVAACTCAWLAVTHVVEPIARAALRDARAEAAARVQPLPGRTLRVGDWALSVDGGALVFAGGCDDDDGCDPIVGRARAWDVSPAEGGVVARLRDGTLHTLGDDATRVTFDALDAPVPLAGGRRVQAAERTTPALLASATRASAYERWILHKRTLLPLTVALLTVAGVPIALAARGRVPAGPIAGTGLLALWVAVRVLDGLTQRGASPFVTGAVLLGTSLVLLATTWARWADR